MNTENKKVIRDGKVAVLYSPGFGAGWYSWNKDVPECLFHPTLVEMVESGKIKDISDEFVQGLLGVEHFYSGGSLDLKIQWITQGTHFDIDEYDGSESIQTFDDIKLIA